MQKRRIRRATAFLLIVCLLVLSQWPVRLVRSPDITIFSVAYKGQDLTEQTDPAAVAALLTRCFRDRFATGNRKYDPDTLLIKLSGYADGDTFEILLGESYQYFNDTEHTFYWIRNGNKLTAQLEELFQSSGK